MSAVITYMLAFDHPSLDRLGRPKMFMASRFAAMLHRRAHFDAGQFIGSVWDDDEGARKKLLP